MGLGKTIQTLAPLSLEKEQGRLNTPSLFVAPTSLVSNWAAEAKRFAPSLKILVLHGANRDEHFESIKNCDLAITTYALLHRDEEILLKEPYY